MPNSIGFFDVENMVLPCEASLRGEKSRKKSGHRVLIKATKQKIGEGSACPRVYFITDLVSLDTDISGQLTQKMNIEAVAMDMSPAYSNAVRGNLQKAAIVFDHFHVIKMINVR